jgi:hypothetical protein
MPRLTPETTQQSFFNSFRNNAYPNGSVSGPYNAEVWRREYVGSVTPGYPNVKPLPFNYHDVDIRRLRFNEIRKEYWYASNTWGKEVGSGPCYGLPMPSNATLAPLADIFNHDVDYRARSKVISKIQRQAVNLAQNLGEHRQVSSMFSTNVMRIANAYRALRRGDVRGYSRHIPIRKRHEQSLLKRGPLDIRRHAPSIWLETQYGWTPLLGDIYTGITNFYKRVGEGYPIRAIGSSGRTLVTSKFNQPSGVGFFQHDEFVRKSMFVKYIVEYEVDATYLANADDWGITNPALLAWELLPYSFVVDWFLPVGDWISQVGYSLGLHYRRGMKSGLVKTTMIRKYEAQPIALPKTQFVQGTTQAEAIRFRRITLGTFPTPGRPRFDKDGLRGKRILNALSLLSLAFDRKGR